MTEQSLPERERAVRDSTRAVVADRSLCRQISAALFTDPGPIEQAFLGEPVLEVMGMFIWCLDKEVEDSRFDASIALPAWARKRGRGAWRQPRAGLRTWEGNSPREDAEISAAVDGTINCRVESMWQCAACSGRFRGEPVEVPSGNGTFHAGDTLCPGCARKHGAA